ncbi:MAG: methyltransferase [Pseudomonadota bacterium]
MNNRSVPSIFSAKRRAARVSRAASFAARPDAARWLIEEMERDCIERIGFMRLQPKNALVVGPSPRELPAELERLECETLSLPAHDEEQPWQSAALDLIVSLSRLDTVNDLPGALLHYRNALSEGGIMIAQMLGAGSLPVLRDILLNADHDRPAARIHPQIDNRAATGLLERAGFKRQVVDGHTMRVSYTSFARLIADLREQALNNVLADPPPPLTRTALARAHQAFDAMKDEEGRVTETFELLTLTGWR